MFSYSKDNCPITTQITSSNDAIVQLLQRIEDMQIRLKSPELQPEKRQAIEQELDEIKKLLHTNRDILSKLQKENTKSFALTACLVFACFLLYGLYVMIYGP